jgi:hypothetical protein
VKWLEITKTEIEATEPMKKISQLKASVLNLTSNLIAKLDTRLETTTWKHKRFWILASYTTALFITLLVFNLINSILPTAGDISIYYKYATLMLNGKLPYHDFSVEYPPLAIIFFMLPAWVSNWFGLPSLSRFAVVFHTECFILAVGTLAIISATWRQLYPKAKTVVWTWRVGLYTFGSLVICLYLLQRFDIAAAFLTALALYLFCRQKPALTGGVLAVGTLVKLYPALLIPLLLMYYWHKQRDWQASTRLTLGFAGTSLAVMLPVAILVTPTSLLGFLEYHAERGIQTESIFASLIMLGRTFGLITATISDDHGSLNLASDWSKPLASFSSLLTILGLLVIYWLIWKFISNFRVGQPVAERLVTPKPNANFIGFVAQRESPDLSMKEKDTKSIKNTERGTVSIEWVLQAAALIILWFMLANKVISPQYMIWLLPFLPFWKGAKVWLYLLALSLSFIPFPFLVVGIIKLEPLPYLILVLRNTLLAIIFVQLLNDLRGKLPNARLSTPKRPIQKFYIGS